MSDDQGELFVTRRSFRVDSMVNGFDMITLRSPIARNTDPETSHDAAAETKTARKRHCRLILDAVRRQPGMIRPEIATATDLSDYEASKRISDLVNAGKVRYGHPKKSEASGRNCQTVWAAELNIPGASK